MVPRLLLTVILDLVQTSSSGCKSLKHVWHDSIVDYAKDNSAYMNVFSKISRRWLREIRHWLHGKLMRWLLLSSLLYCNIHVISWPVLCKNWSQLVFISPINLFNLCATKTKCVTKCQDCNHGLVALRFGLVQSLVFYQFSNLPGWWINLLVIPFGG